MSDKTLHSFDTWATERCQEYNILDLAICVRNNDGIVFQNTYGTQTLKNDALFNIGSISKTFTALAVMQLVEQGKLSLTDKLLDRSPPFKYLPGADREKHALSHELLDNVTLHDALSHQTQFHKGFDNGYWYDGVEPWPTTDQFKEFSIKDARFASDGQNKYSNSVYALLGLVVEEASGMPYREYVQKEIIEKHQLGEIYPRLADVPVDKRDRIAMGSIEGQRTSSLGGDMGAYVPAGGAYATPEAITDFFHKLKTGQILSPKNTEEMFSDINTDSFKLSSRSYGLGTFNHLPKDGEATGRLVGHSGKVDPNNVETLFCETLGLTVFAGQTHTKKLPLAEQLDGSVIIKRILTEIQAVTLTPIMVSAPDRPMQDRPSQASPSAGIQKVARL